MGDSAPPDITKLLTDDSVSPADRIERLLPLVYDELRHVARMRMAAERPGHVLQATALVHEAYVRLVGDGKDDVDREWRNRGHFFAAAGEAMRRILVDQARRRDAAKRGGDRQRVDLDGVLIAAAIETGDRPVDLVALDEALTRLEAEDERKATLVKLRFFAGVTLDQAAAALDISPATADRDWAYSKAFLFAEIRARQGS